MEVTIKSKGRVYQAVYCLLALLFLVGCNPLKMPKDPYQSIVKSGSTFNHNSKSAQALECQACHEKNRPQETPPHGEGKDCKGCHNVTAWKFSTGAFDHSKVANEACSSCHEKDRPITDPAHGGGADCKSCHSAGVNWLTGISSPHNPEPAACNNCHGTSGVRNSFPTKHIATNGLDCKSCHQATVGIYVNWKGGFFNHSPEPAACATCHSDTGAKDSFPANHIATQGFDCKSCHQSSVGNYLSWQGGIFNHTPTPASCATCHADGALRDSFPATHIPTQGLDCKSCHQASISGAYLNWKNAQFSHNPQPAACSTCHGDGGLKDSFPATHIPTQGFDCKSCHQSTLTNFTSWAGGIFNHNPTPAACATCHADNAPRDSFPAGHIPTNGADCKSCHSNSITLGYVNWQNATFNHSPTPASCASCHSPGGINNSFPTSHIPTLGLDCKSCHQSSVTNGFVNWTNGTYSHNPTPATCANCHGDSALKDSFPAAHIPTQGLDCKSCHQTSITSGFNNWTGGNFSHNPVPATCATCHGDGGQKDSFPANHIATQGLDCKSCHQSTLTNFTSWVGGIYNHSPEPATCSTCHATGTAHNSFPAVHIPTNGADCKSCHQASLTNSFANWNDGQFSHSPEPSSCSTCHSTGGIHNSLPTVHIPTNGADCKTCHQASVSNNFSSWLGANYTHNPVPATCATCHADGTINDSFPATHIATNGLDCKSCHMASVTTGFNNWTGAVFNHSPVPTSCASCHADGMIHDSFPANHVNTNGADCKSCHQASVTNGFNSWLGANFNHNPTPSTCSTCHADGASNDSYPAVHIPINGADCKTCHQATITGGFVSWTNGNYSHNPVPGTCANCHADNAPKDSFPAIHIATNGADCKSCHQSSITGGFVNWTNGQFSHSPTPAACATCHADGMIRDSFPAVHIATNGADCKTCHQASITGGFANWTNGTYSHNPTPAACATCHADNMPKDSFPAVHIATNGADCKSCHQASITSGYTNWTNGQFSHSPTPAACATCHADNMIHDSFPAVHIATNGADCKTCHQASITGGFNSWTNGTYSHNPTPAACATCHADNMIHDSFPAGHVSTGGADCKSCHQASINTGYTNWTGATFTHTTTLINQKNCNSCHAGDRPAIGRLMAQDPALTASSGHYGQYDCYFCHKTTLQFNDWNSSTTNHYNASGTKIQSCMPCHYSRKEPQFDQTSNGRISKHANQNSYFTPPIYDINAVGNQPGANGKLGNCFSCHTTRRNF